VLGDAGAGLGSRAAWAPRRSAARVGTGAGGVVCFWQRRAQGALMIFEHVHLSNHRLKLAARGTLTAGTQRRRSHAAA
jgi:hypothetical protein